MKKKSRIAIALIVLFLIGIGVMIWPPPEQARADVTYSLDVRCGADGHNDAWAANAMLRFRFNIGGIWGSWYTPNVVDGAHFFPISTLSRDILAGRVSRYRSIY